MSNRGRLRNKVDRNRDNLGNGEGPGDEPCTEVLAPILKLPSSRIRITPSEREIGFAFEGVEFRSEARARETPFDRRMMRSIGHSAQDWRIKL